MNKLYANNTFAEDKITTLNNVTSSLLASNGNVLKPQQDKRTYRTIILSNKIRTVLVSDQTLNKLSVNLRLGQGSFQDPSAHQGFAHLFEHVILGGSPRCSILSYFTDRCEFFRFFNDEEGVRGVGGMTYQDNTVFYFNINNTKIEQALDKFSGIFQPDFTIAEVKRGIRSLSKHPDKFSEEILKITHIDANKNHPITYQVDGNNESIGYSLEKDDLERSRNDLIAHYNQQFSGNNITLAIVGAGTLDTLQSYAEQYFSFIPNKNITPPTVNIPHFTSAELQQHIYIEPSENLANFKNRLIFEFQLKNNHNQWRNKPNEYIKAQLTSTDEHALLAQLKRSGLANKIFASALPNFYGANGKFSIDIVLTELGMTNSEQVINKTYQYLATLAKQGNNKNSYKTLALSAEKTFENEIEYNPQKLASLLTANLLKYPAEYSLKGDFTFESYNAAPINEVLSQLTPENTRLIHFIKHEKMTSIQGIKSTYNIVKFSDVELARWKNQNH